MANFRVDYTDDQGEIAVVYLQNRQEAMTKARMLSKKFGSAYAIRHADYKDTGQRVYHDGRYSHTDDAF